MDDLSRRDFLGLAAVFVAAPEWRRLVPTDVHIALIHAADFATGARAAEMSAAEARRAAQLLRREFRFTVVQDTEFRDVPADWTAVIRATRRTLDVPYWIPVVDVANRPACARNVFYLRPPSPLAVWHSSLDRFGAGQLNARFRAAGITNINDQAWLGWFAVKCLWEAGLRNTSLKELSFDGHKGRALTFNRARWLLQPMYRLSADKKRVLEEKAPESIPQGRRCAR